MLTQAAISAVTHRLARSSGRGPAAIGWVYALTLGFGLVYLGEHYLIDLLAGLALAEGIWRVAPRVEVAIRMIAAAVHRLEPRAG